MAGDPHHPPRHRQRDALQPRGTVRGPPVVLPRRLFGYPHPAQIFPHFSSVDLNGSGELYQEACMLPQDVCIACRNPLGIRFFKVFRGLLLWTPFHVFRFNLKSGLRFHERPEKHESPVTGKNCAIRSFRSVSCLSWTFHGLFQVYRVTGPPAVSPSTYSGRTTWCLTVPALLPWSAWIISSAAFLPSSSASMA